MDEDVTAADLAEENALGGIVEEVHITTRDSAAADE
jgi:hypothetical protein